MGRRSPAEIYIQQSHLPVLLTMAADGSCEEAMRSGENVQAFVDGLMRKFDDAVDMVTPRREASSTGACESSHKIIESSGVKLSALSILV
jgi:hypothetical protein